MATNSLSVNVFLLLFLIIAAGCDRQKDPVGDEGSAFSATTPLCDVSEDNSALEILPVKSVLEEPLSPDRVRLKMVRTALDEGDVLKAMRIARGLIDSADSDVRYDLIEMFKWVGKKALPELTELTRDSNAKVTSEALAAWEFVIQEVQYDFVKVVAITNIAASSDNPNVIESVLTHTLNMEHRYSLPALEGLIVGFRGKTCGQCAKRMFEHIAGEPWASPARTRAILKEESEIR